MMVMVAAAARVRAEDIATVTLITVDSNHPFSLNDTIRTRSAGRIFAPDFISFFAGPKLGCIIQFCLTQNCATAEAKISEHV